MAVEEGTTAAGAGPDRPTRDWAAIIRARLAGSVPRHGIEEWRVPGLSAAESRLHRGYFPANARPAAVLVPLVERPALTVLLTQRATQLRDHAGQIAFPGGRIEGSDGSPQAAALREAHEEIGLESELHPDHRLPARPRGDDRLSRDPGGRLRAAGI